MVADTLADYYFTTAKLTNQNLKNKGASEGQIFFVGNVIINILLEIQHRVYNPTIFK